MTNNSRFANADTSAEVRTAVLILTRNHEAFIGACLNSVLHSSLERYHVWVLDDGSTDATRNVVEEIAERSGKITLLRQTHSGGRTSGCSQLLIDRSVGEYIVLMSGDDLFGPTNGIEKAVDFLDADPTLAVVIPRMVYLLEDPSRSAPECHGPDLLVALRSGDPTNVLERHLFRRVSRIFLQGMVIRRSIIEEFGGFDTDVLADDYAFIMRLFEHLRNSDHTFFFDEENFWLYRIHATNVHRDSVRQFTLIAEVVGRYLPAKALNAFKWDAVVLENYDQWLRIWETAIMLLGQGHGKRALEPAMRATIKTASRNGNVWLICRFLLGKGVPIAKRALAAWYLPKAMVHRLNAIGGLRVTRTNPTVR